MKKRQTPSLHFRVGHAIDQAIGLVAPRWAWERARLRLVNEAAYCTDTKTMSFLRSSGLTFIETILPPR